MYTVKSYSNITKVVSIAVLMNATYAVADTSETNFVSKFDTQTNFMVSAIITGKLEKINSVSRELSIVDSTGAISNEFPYPRTELGRKLLEHRRNALARGMKLLTADEINLMVNEERGNFS
ncbi:MAG: hypothetical protein Q8K74_03565 [Candidatus Nitrotoga sp.]|nr:hypothetical protein [Candidatus Nitrotoga sp.]